LGDSRGVEKAGAGAGGLLELDMAD
jgi:hypothetical protein